MATSEKTVQHDTPQYRITAFLVRASPNIEVIFKIMWLGSKKNQLNNFKNFRRVDVIIVLVYNCFAERSYLRLGIDLPLVRQPFSSPVLEGDQAAPLWL